MEEERKFTVYMHISPSGKKYIGITSRRVKERWINGKGYKGQVFEHAIKKYGWDNIKHEILYSGLTKQQACQMEIDLIKKYKANDSRHGYNVAKGGECNNLGLTMSIETKEKISRSVYQFSTDGTFLKRWRSAIQAEQNLGYSSSMICSNCRERIFTANGFVWKYTDNEIFNTNLPNSIKIKKQIQSYLLDNISKKNIYQYDSNGVFIRKWKSARDIEKELSIQHSSILRACHRDNHKFNNYMWCYYKVNKLSKYVKKRKVCLINQISSDNRVLKTWENTYAIKKYYGFNGSNILKACKNQIRTAYNFKWQFAKGENDE